jgi:Holliday junction resolvase RusA-like endonuclease
MFSTDVLELVYPFLPYSLNSAYGVGNGNFYMKGKAKDYKDKVRLHTQGESCRFLDRARFHVIDIQCFGKHYEWREGVGWDTRYLKQDFDNGIKLTVDSIYQALGLNDRRVFRSENIEQIQHDTEIMVIKIRPGIPRRVESGKLIPLYETKGTPQ